MCDIQRRKIAIPAATAATPPAAAVTVAAVPPIQPVATVSPSDSGEEQVISSNSSQANTPMSRDWSSGNSNSELVGENDRLRRENTQLNKELSQMKSLCNNIYVMMSNYGSNPPESSSRPETTVEPLDLLPLKQVCDDFALGSNRMESEEDSSPRLFGVAIGAKRVRYNEGEATEQQQELQLQQPGAEVKLEPMDH